MRAKVTSQLILATCLAFLTALTPTTHAANFVMSGNDAVGVTSFNTGTNWTGGAAPAPGNTYQTAAFLLRTPPNSSPATFAGNSLEVQAGGNLRDKTSGATITVNNLILDDTGIFDMSGNGGSLAGNLTLSGGTAYISVGSGNIFTCLSTISGPGGFNTFNAVSSSGPNTNILTAANSYSGATLITGPAGTVLQLGNANAVSNSTVNVGVTNGLKFSSGIGAFNLGGLAGASNFTLVDAAAAAVTIRVGANNASSTFSGSLSGAGALTKVGTGILTLSSPNTYSGATLLAGGTLALSGSGSINSSASLTLSNASFDISASSGPFLFPGPMVVTNGTFTLAAVQATNTSLSLSNATLSLAVSAGSTNIVTGTLTTGGSTNIINVTSLPGLASYPTNLTLIKYSSAVGVAGGGNILSSLGVILTTNGNPVGYLTNNLAKSSIDLVIVSATLPPPIVPLTWTGRTNGVNVGRWDILTTSNWFNTGGSTVYSYQDGSPVTFDDSAAGATTVTIQTTVNPSGITVNNSAKSYTFTGASGITGTSSLLKTNSGSLTLFESADNFTGGIAMRGGSLTLSNSAASISGGVSVLNGAVTLAHSGTISGGLSLDNTAGGSPSAVFLGSGTLNGGITLNGGTVLLDQTTAPSGNTTISAGTLQVGNSDANGVLPSGTVTDNGSLVFNQTGNATVGNTISGSGTLTKTNSGTLTLSVANSLSGGITINGGTLQSSSVGGGNTPLGSGTTTINSGGTLAGTGQDAFGYYPHTAPTTFFINGGTMTEVASSSFRITLPNLTFQGGTLTSAPGNNGDASGNYSLFGAGAPTIVTTLSNNTTAVISAGKVALQQNGQTTGVTTFSVAQGNVTGGSTPGVDLLVSSPLVQWTGNTPGILKTGPGVMALTGANTFTGGTIISGGTLQLGAATDIAALTQTLGTGPVTNNALLSFGSSQTVTVANAISGSGAVTISTGTGILTGVNTYSGGTTVAGGTLQVNNISGSGTGSGNVTVNSTGTLGGTGTISGNVTVNGATLPGSATASATTTIASNLTYTAGASAKFHLSPTAASGNDQIVLSGVNSLLTCGGATVGIILTNASLDQANDYVLFNETGGSASITGSFAATPVWLGTTPANAGSYSIVGLGTKIVLHYSASGTTNLPAVTNLPASNIGFTSANLNGQVISTGGEFPTVRVYYGPVNGGTNPAAWAANVSLGLQSGSFNRAVSNLTANTTYYFAFSASNSAGTAWATPSQSFTTLALVTATVTNLPASNVQGKSAILNGQVLSTGNQIPTITLYYGAVNGGTNTSAWANNIFLGSQSNTFAATVTGLTTNTTYYFAAAAVNNAGTAWGRPSLSFTTLPTAPVVPVLTYHNDNARTGANTNETLLAPATLNTNNFGLLIQYPVDGYVFAQPLYVPNLAIPGQGTHNVVFVATEHDTVYAFDADNNAGANGGLLWKTNLGVAPLSNNQEFGGRYHNNNYIDLTPEVGITGTPVIDLAAGTLYVDALTREVTGTTNYYHRIHALNITNGTEQPFSPVLVTASVPGRGVGGNGTTVPFTAIMHGQRPALTLAGGKLYVPYGSFADTDPYHGWVIGFNTSNLQLLTNYVFNTTPNATVAAFGANAGEGAIWMGGNGLCVDSNNFLYFETANGSFSANTNGGDYSDSFLKLTTSNLLAVADYFTPSNQANLASGDTDLGSGGALLLPDEVGSAAHPHLMVGGGKAGLIYLLDRDNMGHYNTGTNFSVEEVASGAGSFFGTPAYFNYQLYYQGKGGVMRAFTMTNGVLGKTPTSSTATSFAGWGVTPTISANGPNNGIVWTIQTDGSSPSDTGAAVLHAYNATNLAVELYNSSQNFARDNPGGGVKYTLPTVADGKVFVGAQYALSIFGYTTFLATPTISPHDIAFTNSVTVTLADATPGAVIYYTLDGTTPGTNSILYTAPILITTTLNLQAIAVKPGAANSGIASASFVNTAALGNGAGLSAQYWSNTPAAVFTNVAFSAAPTLTRTDAVVNFNWTTNGPAPVIGQTNFTARWTGSVQPQYTETYTFTTIADDGVRLWVNGQLLINDWNTHSSAATNSGVLSLNAQQLYTVRLDYFQNVSNSVAQLLWSSPSTAQSIVPQTQLYPYTNPPPAISLASPTNGSAYTAVASVTIGAEADALYNPIQKVDFYTNGVLLGTLSNSPYAPLYAFTTTGLNAGSYTLTAVAIDGSGLSSTSGPVNISVATGSGLPYGLITRGTVQPYLNMPSSFNGSLPALLSGTGAYSTTSNRTAASGLIPYQPNTPLWSDAAVKSRYLAVPYNGGPISPDQQVSFAPTNSWTFPAGTVFVKNFDLVVNETNSSAPLRRLETRLLVRNATGGVYGVTYKWRPNNTDADLLASSLPEDILITNATGVRTQTWYYPSPADCLTCHTPAANYVLGVNTRQLNGNLTYAATGNTDNQLRTLNRLGLFYPAISEAGISNYAKLSALTNLSASLQERARSYLDANCAQCHNPAGTGITFDARYDTPLANQHLTNYPAAFSLGYDRACVVKAQDVWRSVLMYRIQTNDPAIKMPPLARNLVDTNAVQVLTDWINSLPGLPALPPPAITPNGGTFYPSVSVTLQSPNTNATFHYTLDGSLPTSSSQAYSGPFTLTNSLTLMVNAFAPGFDNSVAASAIFTIPTSVYFTSSTFTTNGQFQLTFSGVSGNTYVLEASTNLLNWIPLSTNVAPSNLFNLYDPAAANFPRRFYRVIQQ